MGRLKHFLTKKDPMVDFVPHEAAFPAIEEKRPAYILCACQSAAEENTPAYVLRSTDSSAIKAPLLPSDQDIQKYVGEIKRIFAAGFQWADIPAMIRIELEFLDQFFELTVEQKRCYSTQILDRAIDKMEDHLLPKSFSHPIYKTLAEHLINILVPDSMDIYLPPQTTEGAPDHAAITKAVDAIIQDFKGGFHWKYVAYLVEMGVKFGNQFESLTSAERADITKNLISLIISKVEVPFLPECVAEPILNMIADSLIDEIFAKL